MAAEPSGHALLSGGSSGIGLALAHRLARAGWALTILARNSDRLAAARAVLARHGRPVRTVSADVADEAAVAAAVAASAEALGPPRLVVACAGIVRPGVIRALPGDDFRRSMEVNYLGSLHLVRAALPLLPRHAGARIVLIASGSAFLGLYGYGAYAPSKFAVRGLGEVLRSELAPEGIAVSVVYPPDTDTPGYREELLRRPAITGMLARSGGLMSPDQVASAIMRGTARDRFTIAPGATMTLLARLHSVIVPVLNRIRFDPLIRRESRRVAARVDRAAGPTPPWCHEPQRARGGSMTTSVKELLATANAAVPRIARAEAEALLADGKALLVDVRDAPELQAGGKIRGARHVSRGMIEFRADPASPYHDPDFDPDRTVILYCASGGRSALAGKALQDLGYRDVRNLGAFKDWAENGGAVEPA